MPGEFWGELPKPVKRVTGGRTGTTRPKGQAKRTPTGRAVGHNKDGRYRRGMGKPKACSVRGCQTEQIALGYCRKHYERFKKYGDPKVVGRSGSPKLIPSALDAAGISQRQRNHWISLGHIPGKIDARTERFLWTTDATRVALLIQRLLAVGFPLPMAGAVAKETVQHGASSVAVAPGVAVSVVDDTREVSAL